MYHSNLRQQKFCCGSLDSISRAADRLSKPAALVTLVFLKIVKMMCSEIVTRLKEPL